MCGFSVSSRFVSSVSLAVRLLQLSCISVIAPVGPARSGPCRRRSASLGCLVSRGSCVLAVLALGVRRVTSASRGIVCVFAVPPALGVARRAAPLVRGSD